MTREQPYARGTWCFAGASSDWGRTSSSHLAPPAAHRRVRRRGVPRSRCSRSPDHGARPAQCRRAADYLPGQVVVGLRAGATAVTAQDSRRMGIRVPPGTRSRVVRLPRGAQRRPAAARMRRQPGVPTPCPTTWRMPPGAGSRTTGPGRPSAQGWQQTPVEPVADQRCRRPDRVVQSAPPIIPVVAARWSRSSTRAWLTGTGAAIAGRRTSRTRFVAPYDFVAGNAYPLDREGHGTFIAGEVAESTNNGIGVTGLAYGAR